MPDDASHILVVDDDERLRELLRRFLSDQGFRVTTGDDAADARTRLASFSFDLIVLDIMMPGENGLELTESLRHKNDVPILLLTAMSDAEDRIQGLSVGADDYLAKPFEPRELVLRIQSILRRAQREALPEIKQVHFGSYCFDLTRDELRRNEEFIRLTTAEVLLLRALSAQPGVPISREDLAAKSRISGSARTIDVQMTRLRRKVEEDPKYPRYLQTVRGTGYVLMPD